MKGGITNTTSNTTADRISIAFASAKENVGGKTSVVPGPPRVVKKHIHHRRQPSGGARIRKNFIHKLGIAPAATTTTTTAYKQSNLISPSTHKKTLLGSNPTIIVEPLNDHDTFCDSQPTSVWDYLFKTSKKKSEPLGASPSSTASTQLSHESGCEKPQQNQQQRRLAFHEEVSVCPIPRRDQYSNRIRQQLWPTAEDMTKAAQKNTLEFASEGWDWRKSIDTDEMYFDVATGEYIHPIHIMVERHQNHQAFLDEQEQQAQAEESKQWQ